MASEQPLSGAEFRAFTDKLEDFATRDLSSKERWFLREALQKGVVGAYAGDVEGYTLPLDTINTGATLPEGVVYFPVGFESYFGISGPLLAVANKGF